jgi:hypothetical protein
MEISGNHPYHYKTKLGLDSKNCKNLGSVPFSAHTVTAMVQRGEILSLTFN